MQGLLPYASKDPRYNRRLRAATQNLISLLIMGGNFTEAREMIVGVAGIFPPDVLQRLIAFVQIHFATRQSGVLIPDDPQPIT